MPTSIYFEATNICQRHVGFIKMVSLNATEAMDSWIDLFGPH